MVEYDPEHAHPYTVERSGLKPPSSNWSDIKCPFCGTVSRAYWWSIAGSGKKCPCGALHGSGGMTIPPKWFGVGQVMLDGPDFHSPVEEIEARIAELLSVPKAHRDPLAKAQLGYLQVVLRRVRKGHVLPRRLRHPAT